MVFPTNRRKGFVSYDGLFSLLPVLMLTVFVLGTMQYLLSDSVDKMDSQEKYNLLVSVADYIVKDGGAYKEGEKVYPNWISETELGAVRSQLSEIRSMLGLPGLDFGLEDAEGYDGESGKTCVYRLVVSGQEKELDRLFVCG